MPEMISHDIKVRVSPHYHGNYKGANFNLSAFSYLVVIENKSRHIFQLISRFWMIKDPLYPVKIIEGEGVIGETPILHPEAVFAYRSNAISKSGMGAMKGHYILKNLASNELIKVKIPCFQLTAKYLRN